MGVIELNSAVITYPLKNSSVPPGPIKVEGTTSLSTQIVVELFKGEDLVERRIGVISSGKWSATVTLQEPATYRLVARQAVEARVDFMVAVPIPEITLPASNAIVNMPLAVSGKNGILGGIIELYTSLTGAVIKQQAVTASNGVWTINVEKWEWSANSVFARQKFSGYQSAPSNTVTGLRIITPVITNPAQNEIVPLRPLFSGQASPGALVTVRQISPDKLLVSNALVDARGAWSKTSETDLSKGLVTIRAKATMAGLESAETSDYVVYTVPQTPSITGPDASVVQNTTFEVTGNRGIKGCDIRILKDLSDLQLGTVTNQSDGDWKVSVTVPAGNNSLVAEQVKGNVHSERSAPRAFRVRPPVLSSIKVEHPSISSAKFSGTGLNGATVEIKIVSGSADASPPPVVVVSNGKWEVTSQKWPPGSYMLSAVQKVSDNASGWIESTPTTFTDNHGVPDPSDIIYTNVYTPVFSGKGLSGATVRLFNADLTTQVAAQAMVSNGVWTSRALEEWGPTLDRAVHAKQYVSGQASPNWIGLKVNIPPLAPGSVVAVEADQSPHISGTCWPGAAVTLEYNNDGVKHRPTVTGGTWTFRRDEPFAPGVTHRFSVTQTVASQTSVPATGSFTVRRAMLKPEITVPAEGAEVSRNTTVSGELGMEGATMRVWDEQYGTVLNSKRLTSDGDWSIELTDLRYGKLSLTAQQTLENDSSHRSEIRVCHVVLKPPVLLVPGEGGHLPRQSTVSGTGWPGARVNAWLVGVDEPLLREVLVSASGQWSGQVTLPQVGYYKMRLQQTSDSETSKDLLCDFQVVPSSPVIESPTQSAVIGGAVVVSGFGFPGDTVTVKLSTGTTLGSVQVLEDRTWSLSAGIDHSGGPSALTVQASCGEFVSAVSDPRPVQINTWLPHIEDPSAGRWVAAPVTFAGTGKAGVGQVVSWFNPDVVWADDLAVSDGQWRGEAMTALAPTGNWYRFRQSFAPGADPALGSDWAVSPRFEVLPPGQSS